VCRLFGLHAGAHDVNATFWLLDAPVSIAELSHRNADGYGLATFGSDGELDLVRAPVRAADDEDFATTARATHAAVYLAHVRYADTGQASEANTHPFSLDGRAFAHNGVVSDLGELDLRLGADRALVQGETDSERFFALMTLAIREHDGDVRAGIIAATRQLAQPTIRSTSCPSRITTNSGIERAPNRVASPGFASTSTLTTLRCPACFWASCSRTGETIRQGPHQAAQKSTTTGTEVRVSAANVSPSASTSHASSDLHFGQRGTPWLIGPARLRAPHVWQLMIVISRE
jgi:Glutamine amidotransferases class-II